MPKNSDNKVITDLAPCGLVCSSCDSYLAKKCLSCYEEISRGVKTCPVTAGERYKESEKLIQCLGSGELDRCIDCESFEDCEIYDTMLMKCPFKGPVHDLKPGFSYLVEEMKPELSFKIFIELVRFGSNGLCISRQHPKNLKKKVRQGNVEIIWLTSLEGKGNIDPTNLGILSDTIIRFTENHKNPVILLDGLELLITHADFQKVLRMLNHITEQVMQHSARIVVSIDERTLDKKEVALLERNMEVIGR